MNCLLKHVTEGKIEGKIKGTGRQGRRRKQLSVDLTETRRHWKLKAEALYCTLWSSCFGRRPLCKREYVMTTMMVKIMMMMSSLYFCIMLMTRLRS